MVEIRSGERIARIELIAKKISQGYTDTEIMEELKLRRARFYLYKKKVYNVWGDLAAKKTQATVEFEAGVLKDRLTRLLRQLELRISNAPPGESLSELADASAVATQIGITIFRLEVETLRAREEHKKLAYVQRQAAKYLGDIRTELPESDITQGEETNNQEQQRLDEFRDIQEKVF